MRATRERAGRVSTHDSRLALGGGAGEGAGKHPSPLKFQVGSTQPCGGSPGEAAVRGAPLPAVPTQYRAVLRHVGTNSWSLGHHPPCAFSEPHTQAWGDGFWGDLGLGLIPRAGVGLPGWVRGTHSGKLGKGILLEKRVN